MLPNSESQAEIELYRAILQACRDARSVLTGEQADTPDIENVPAPELAHYRQSLQAGLDRLQGTFRQTLGGSDNG